MKTELVARHRLAEGKGELIVDPQHYASIRRYDHQDSRTGHERRFLAAFPDGGPFLEALKARVRQLFPIHVNSILSHLSLYTRTQVSHALVRAIEDGEPNAPYVSVVLGRLWPEQVSGRKHNPLTLGPVACADGSS
ncbi:MAG: hypothetical protein FJW35_06130, partial [Acidobacteria bacterium]|nr:hypothetical protein [Acidobacteriota bacterium]